MFFENEYLNYTVQTLSYLGCVAILFVVGKLIFHLLKSDVKIREELTEKDNFAFFITYIGYFAGLLIAIGSILIGPEQDFFTDIIEMLAFGALAIFFLNLGALINDKIILRGISVKSEIVTQENVGVAIVEAGNYISTGLIIYGAVSGVSENLVFGLLIASLFWIVGQILFVLTAFLYQWLVPYSVLKNLKKGRIGVAIGMSAALVAIANLISYALFGDFVSYTDTFIDLGIELALGLILLPLMRLTVEKLMLPGTNITHEIIHQSKESYGAAFLEAFAYIGSSTLIIWII